jgi:hypothetical protein
VAQIEIRFREDHANNKPRPHAELLVLDHYTSQMLQKMLFSIRQDLQDQILSRRPKRKRLPDSTTGISSVIYEIHTAGTAFDYNAGKLEPTSGDPSIRQPAPFETVDRTGLGSEIREDSDNVD